MRPITKRLRAAIVLAVAPLVGAFALSAAARPALVVSIEVKAKDRSELRTALAERVAPRLKAELGRGWLDGYQLYASRYPDRGVWDAMAVLTFKTEAAFASWTAASHGDGGLDPSTLALAETVVSTPVEIGRSAQAQGVGGPHPAFLIVPYQSLVPAGEYSKYLDDYTFPQFAGWMKAGVLDGYTVALSRYPAGRPWSSMIILRYHDDAALAKRDEVVAKVRRELAGNPTWKAVSDSKQAIRTEKALAVADLIAEDGVEP